MGLKICPVSFYFQLLHLAFPILPTLVNFVQDERIAVNENGIKIMKSLDENYISDADLVLRTKDEMKQHCKAVSQWAEENKNFVQQQSTQLGEFWNTTYKIDMPTGVTPKKKRYKYPKSLTTTSPIKPLPMTNGVMYETDPTVQQVDIDSELQALSDPDNRNGA